MALWAIANSANNKNGLSCLRYSSAACIFNEECLISGNTIHKCTTSIEKLNINSQTNWELILPIDNKKLITSQDSHTHHKIKAKIKIGYVLLFISSWNNSYYNICIWQGQVFSFYINEDDWNFMRIELAYPN